MSFFSLIAVFLIEQLKPLHYRRVVEEPLFAWADFIQSRFDAGEYRQGLIAWCLAVVAPVVLVAVIYGFIFSLSPLLGWLFNAGVLYLTLGFRQFSHYYNEIDLALRMDDLPRARQLLGEWRGRSADGLGSQDIARLAIENGLLAAHRHVFAIILCFVLLPGPSGAVLYRMAAVVRERWQAGISEERNDFPTFSARVFSIIDWLPARATAAAFAIVGDFEDALYCWRTQAARWPDRNSGIVLAGGAGALGVQLGLPLAEGSEVSEGVALGLGEPAGIDFLQSAVGLVWRATVLWMMLLLLLGLASLAG
jgi:cobalamin biosynthesis protein CobD/CbiB